MSEENDNRVISKRKSGFPAYLDFQKLRVEGIEYLGKLSGKIWTDHNVHDPGITILEALCYALLDLGYRTNLPIKDLLANPVNEVPEIVSFFSPGRILSNNPLTITDYRKLLLDVDEVRNAWLEIATDLQPDNLCGEIISIINAAGNFNESANTDDINTPECCDTYINGLYHVYIDLEKNIDKEFENDIPAKDMYIKDAVKHIQSSLSSHRNLCEDFLDIRILKRIEIGVCANIDLEENADVNRIYLNIAEKLTYFFSPTPKYYTLQQLLEEKKRNIEDIFAGRPLIITKSHGFIDTEELEGLIRRKEIHVSDLYAELLQIRGIKTIRALSIRACDENLQPVNINGGWKFSIPDDYIPEYSWRCSGFTFFKKGAEIPFDAKDLEFTLEMQSKNRSKVYLPSPYLDLAIEKGQYRKELGEYYSTQNDFPKVYGIADGALLDDASDERKSQVLQLKGYLFFFDQLLANYIAQLSQVRKLFAFSQGDKPGGQTYFTELPGGVPKLNSLLRFNETAETDQQSKGIKILAYPISRVKLEAVIKKEKLKQVNIHKDFPSIDFSTANSNRIAIAQMQSDFEKEVVDVQIVEKGKNCYFFYAKSSSEELALLCKRYFDTEREARETADALKYMGQFGENFIQYTLEQGNTYSFDIESTPNSYTRYLQVLTENSELYNRRRLQFLDHLLARFAESFTEFSILSYKNARDNEISLRNAVERFLPKYDDLSSNRGKGYDYLTNGWNNENLSGLEKKFRALSGIESPYRKNLCHFEVFKHKKHFFYSLEFAGNKMFYAEEKFDTPDKAAIAALAMFKALGEDANYSVSPLPETRDRFRLKINAGGLLPAYSLREFPDSADALESIKLLKTVFSGETRDEQAYVSRYKYQARLLDNAEKQLRTLAEEPETEGKAFQLAVKRINQAKNWNLELKAEAPGKLLPVNGDAINGILLSGTKKDKRIYFVDVSAFKNDINNTIIGKPDKFTYDILDKGNAFKFSSTKEFGTDKEAEADYQVLIGKLTKEKNYRVISEEENAHFLEIWEGEERWARYAREFASKPEAGELKKEVIRLVQKHLYHIAVSEEPDRWNFHFSLGCFPGEQWTFEYLAEDFDSDKAALKAAAAFRGSIKSIEAIEKANEIILLREKTRNIPLAILVQTDDKDSSDQINSLEKVNKQLALVKSIQAIVAKPDMAAFRQSVKEDDMSACGEFGYRLVDNDNLLAFSIPPGKANHRPTAEQYLEDIISNYSKGYAYLKIAMGGDMVRERKDNPEKKSWYHYQVKSLEKIQGHNNSWIPELVLLESVKGYASREEAEKAFQKNIFDIIIYASSADNYGKGRIISDLEILAHGEQGSCEPVGGLVYTPKETLDFLGTYVDEAIRKLVELAISYPVRIIYPESSPEIKKAFYKLFPCITPEEEVEDIECRREKGKPQYYFVLGQNGKLIWQSAKPYDDPRECLSVFDFFLVLLPYYGNYTLSCDPCAREFRVYIREVLAESTWRFDEEAAWGVDGIQHFICVAQTEKSFFHYLEKENCCHRFYIACNQGALSHPCYYDKMAERDWALNRLRKEGEKLASKLLPWISTMMGKKSLIDWKGKNIADLEWEDEQRSGNASCENEWVEIFHRILTRELMEWEGKLRIEYDKEKYLVFTPTEEDKNNLDSFREKLVCTAMYFPIIISEKIENGKSITCYGVEIRIPGMQTCHEKGYVENPCNCEEDNSGPDCEIAWKSSCCFDTCEEAERQLKAGLRLLLDYKNYRAIDDCICGPYGIALHHWPALEDCREQKKSINQKPEWVIAFNPQCYPSPEMACDAITRAKKLINDEGLHLVEHILLRPRNEVNDECECSKGIVNLDNPTKCSFTRTIPGDPDHCIDPSLVCFIPGEDPYSFIATIALPAWPERYRSANNRQLVETLLRKEAPAHVLLRILWLTPHQLCQFESQFKKWNLWLANKYMCGEEFDYCEFLSFLFHKEFDVLGDCNVCLPCDTGGEPLRPCLELLSARRYSQTEFLTQTNELFEWQKPMVIHHKELDDVLKKPKRVFVNQRRNLNREKMDELLGELKKSGIAAEVKSFLDEANPTPERLEKLTTKMINMVMTSDGKKSSLNKKHASGLLSVAIHHYLDKQVFEIKEMEKIMAISKTLERARDAGLDTLKIFRDWQPDEVIKYESKMPGAEIKRLFLEKPGKP